MKKAIVVNLFGSPGSGKSTAAAGLFYKLKSNGVSCELVTEYAKKLVHSNRAKTLDDQIYVFSKQQHEIRNLERLYDVIVTDSPVLMGLVYAPNYPECFRQTVYWSFSQFENINFMIKRKAKYDPVGRNQDEAGSDALSLTIDDLLTEYNVEHDRVEGTNDGLEYMFGAIKNRLSI